VRSFRHWTPRYLVDRLALLAYERSHADAPWLTRDAVRILEGWLRRQDEGLEWGSGRSTTWFGVRVKHLISVEHDPRWHETVSRSLRERGLKSVECHLLGTEATSSGPAPYLAVSSRIQRGSLDFVLVDGVLRDACAEAAIDLLKEGGVLILDNANWYLPHETRSPASLGPRGTPPTPTWSHVAQQLETFRAIWTSNGVTDTALFVKAG
jgi:predicted O-methyltransferase YrrM